MRRKGGFAVWCGDVIWEGALEQWQEIMLPRSMGVLVAHAPVLVVMSPVCR
jgi:hypothetical protein